MGTLADVQRQRGFSSIEITVAAAIALLVGWQLLTMSHALVFGAARLDDRLRARSAADRLEERLTADAASAWSVFVPANDVNGNRNTDGHEIDFVTEDASHRELWWAYAYDTAARRVTRYSYVPGGSPLGGERFDDLDGLAARTHPLSDVQLRSSAVFDPLFERATLSDIDVAFAWGGTAVGGNHLVAVRIRGQGVERTLLLASGTAPSRFTVVVKYTPPPPTAMP